ncbi:MAG: Na/Pi cotransporter family protein [Candidatus Cloacimonetes bacterium]|jgi:phosphate:Na+ symporter|nr:Na/Pi cotransporter family protein [Candidatus Cloacimonadota bacterium]
MITQLMGGLGLFLLGMVLLTDGLKDAAGEALRGLLVRFTDGRMRALLFGVAATALLQSSTATVLMTIGFVSAGLISLPAAIAVVFGANIGTTSTGWIVAFLGLKLSVGTLAMPLVAIGALMRLLGGGRTAASGLAIAGFGLIFVGIQMLQGGMEVVAQRFDPASFPGGSMGARLVLVIIGIAMTVVMQSSSVAVAATLTALHSGALGIEQAATLVVGQNIGTTATAAIAAIGGSVSARRTAAAHILFNLIAAVFAFSLIPQLPRIGAALWPGNGATDPAILIAAFHTAFSVIGVIVIMPFFSAFTHLIERFAPDRGPDFTRNLDPTVARVPAVAAEAARRSVLGIGIALIAKFRHMLHDPKRTAALTTLLERADTGLDEVRRFLSSATSPDPEHAEQHLGVLHAIEHLERLVDRLGEWPEPDAIGPDFRQAAAAASDVLMWLEDALQDPDADSAVIVERCHALSQRVADLRRAQRERELREAAAGRLDPDVALRRLDAMRWLDSSLYHIWRSTHHALRPGARGEGIETER